MEYRLSFGQSSMLGAKEDTKQNFAFKKLTIYKGVRHVYTHKNNALSCLGSRELKGYSHLFNFTLCFCLTYSLICLYGTGSYISLLPFVDQAPLPYQPSSLFQKATWKFKNLKQMANGIDIKQTDQGKL